MQNNTRAVVLFLVLQIQDSISDVFPECPTVCFPDMDFPQPPVCGSDGITYPNPCSLKVAKCKGKPDLTVAYPGKCEIKG